MDLQLKSRTCLVTGASRGIGRGTAKVLAAEGCRVAVVARRTQLLDELAKEIEAAGGLRPLIVTEDLTSDGGLERGEQRDAKVQDEPELDAQGEIDRRCHAPIIAAASHALGASGRQGVGAGSVDQRGVVGNRDREGAVGDRRLRDELGRLDAPRHALAEGLDEPGDHPGLAVHRDLEPMIGMIALSGIAVRNAILLIEFLHVGLARGQDLREAILQAGAVRTRPILLTAGTAMLAAVPIALDPIFSGLAWSFIFGLFASTAFSLVVVPVIFYLQASRRPAAAQE